MSRFGLRSNPDGLVAKLSEDNSKSKGEKSAYKTDKSAALKRVREKRQNSEKADGKELLEHTSAHQSLVCRVPLSRLTTDILGKLHLSAAAATAAGAIKWQQLDARNASKPSQRRASLGATTINSNIQNNNNNDNDDDDADGDANNGVGGGAGDVDGEVEGYGDGDGYTEGAFGDSRNFEPQTVKILCLFCDKKFTSHKMQAKHVEKFHTQHKDRRCSGRNSQTQQLQQQHTHRKKTPAGAAAMTSSSTSSSSSSSLSNFPGCTFCRRSKTQLIAAPAEELGGLFEHLSACHADKYFGCKMCVLRFQNLAKLVKHMQSVHKHLPFVCDDNSTTTSASKSKDNDFDVSDSCERGGRASKTRLQRQQKTSNGATPISSGAAGVAPGASNGSGGGCGGESIIGAEEPLLSRLGLTQNRLPNNRKGVRLRRDTIASSALLKPDATVTPAFAAVPAAIVAGAAPTAASSSSSLAATATAITATAAAVSPTKVRSKSAKSAAFGGGDPDIVFRVPARSDSASCVFDDDFYKEVVTNVRNNLLYHLDGKIAISGSGVEATPAAPPSTASATTASTATLAAAESNKDHLLPAIRSTVAKNAMVMLANGAVTMGDCELHAATSLSTTTAFPTLLTAEQYGGDATTAKLRRRPHTKHSWKWKWDSVKKYKLISEGGKMVRKMKHPTMGLRDLSKLDMWTQLTMRQKHEHQYNRAVAAAAVAASTATATATSTTISSSSSLSSSSFAVGSVFGQRQQYSSSSSNNNNNNNNNNNEASREEKQRLNAQLNAILDMRLLPHITLEQNEQAVIKLENEEFGIASRVAETDGYDVALMGHTFDDESFLSRLRLLPSDALRQARSKLVLSGEWARPRCYMCMCCGAQFEQLKSLEEHKTFRHSHILSTHYEVVGRELLADNLLRHLFLPKNALSRYSSGGYSTTTASSGSTATRHTGARRKLWNRTKAESARAADTVDGGDAGSIGGGGGGGSGSFNGTTAEDESSDSVQSLGTSCVKSGSTAGNEDIDTDSKTPLLDIATVSPAHSLHSSSSSFATPAALKVAPKRKALTAPPTTAATSAASTTLCTKCSRKCSGVLDLYRHMLDCSGDYIWSLAKKRKYRYYCGSKKRRPCNKHNNLNEMRRNKATKKRIAKATHPPPTALDTEESGSGSGCSNSKTKTPPRQRPSDAESIKKMLENLPPKRICKKIFPTVTKTRKAQQQKKKAQLTKMAATMSKHSRYKTTQVLRKTRARAAKLLSKTKKKFASNAASKNNKNNNNTNNVGRTRDRTTATTPTSARSKDLKATLQRAKKQVAAAIALRKDARKKNAPTEKLPSALTTPTPISTSTSTSPTTTVESLLCPPPADVVAREETAAKVVVAAVAAAVIVEDKEQQCAISEQVAEEKAMSNGTAYSASAKPPPSSAAELVVVNAVAVEAAIAASGACESMRSDQSEPQIAAATATATSTVLHPQCHESDKLPAAPNASPNKSPAIVAESVTSNAGSSGSGGGSGGSNKKRSKRISDCIAMLTGKLEEKLKTEQIGATGKSDEALVEMRGGDASALSEKKTPKRKAISRRIIKPDAVAAPSLSTSPRKADAIVVISATPTAVVAAANQSSPLSLPLPPPPVALKSPFAPVMVEKVVPLPLPVPQSAPLPVPQSAPQPMPLPMPAPVPVPIPAPLPVPIPMPLPMPLPMPAPVPVPMPMPLPMPLPMSAPAPVSVPVSLPVSVAQPIPSRSTLPLPMTVPLHMPHTMPPNMVLYVPAENLRTAVAPPPPLPTLPSLGLPMPIPVQPGVMPPSMPPALPASMTIIHATPPAQAHNFGGVQPLNLSSLSKNSQLLHVTHDLSCKAANAHQRSSLPARRQTICGFEARNLLGLDDMEPLDLSKKAWPAIAQPTKPVEITPLPQPMSPVKLVMEPNSLPKAPPATIMALPPEVLLSKQFYSNLDLLKIPQVRNPGYVPAPLEMAVFNATKFVAKKRGAPKGVIVADASSKPNTVKEQPPPKKETGGKTKPVLKMDEEVINHIDDAINSVINAVTASLPPDDENDVAAVVGASSNSALANPKPALELIEPSVPFKLCEPMLLAAPVASVAPTPSVKPTLAMKRSIRSKTLDCRPAALLAAHIGSSALPQGRCESPCFPQQIVDNTYALAKPKSPVMNTATPIMSVATADFCASVPSTSVSVSSTQQEAPAIIICEQMQPIIEQVINVEPDEKSDVMDASVPEAGHDEGCSKTVATPLVISEPERDIVSSVEPESSLRKDDVAQPTQPCPIQLPSEVPSEVPLPCQLLPVSQETNIHSISEENTSNINNTSSGFHSSGQSEIVVDCKKKTRRRRKNELAAIVADQLLESFKLDKTRRDNLKKLENLAYEKSEDLLLTGMLLMSSTKRNAAMSNAGQSAQAAASEKSSADGTKRQKQQEQTRLTKANSSLANKSLESAAPANGTATQKNQDKNAKKAAVIEVEKEMLCELDNQEATGVRKSKRRQYRRKGKAMDNEKISKLKSSLESFSIGIERQLSEIEAKNAGGVFNVADAKGPAIAPGCATPVKASILRPSILSSLPALEQPNGKPCQQREGKARETAISSRDPRLNKHIHKDEKDVPAPAPVEPSKSEPKVRRRYSDDDKKLDEIGDIEEDNYLTEIAKNVNEKIMSAENEEFVFANDGFELANELQDDSNSKYYRPPTSMSVRSAPNFDDRSEFGSICDENTNTELMDMDLDDEMSVYTSYSQDVGRGRGRRRRRRRSILLKRKPKKRPCVNLSAETFDCSLCTKTFFTTGSLTKHNMTLAHVSKVSEREYLMSKSASNAIAEEEQKSAAVTVAQTQTQMQTPPQPQPQTVAKAANARSARAQSVGVAEGIKMHPRAGRELANKAAPSSGERLTLNPDERLFFECCNILKGAETPRRQNDEDCHNAASYTYAAYAEKPVAPPVVPNICLRPPPRNHEAQSVKKQSTAELKPNGQSPPTMQMQQNVFRDPQSAPLILTKFTAAAPHTAGVNNLLASNYSAISQFSAVTSTTSRFKTKAAMKGYENVHIDFTIQQELESKSRTVCKLTELAEIALGNEKPNLPESELSPVSHDHSSASNDRNQLHTTEYNTVSVVDNNDQKAGNVPASRERPKNAETHSSTSSKTIMHSSIIKAAVNEHNTAPVSKIIIPERPFKNIGLEEKETITFQKPKASVNLLTEDNNSVSTASYSDRDDFDFGSMSSGEDTSIKTSNEKIIKTNTSDSSSSRATAKTFENKSLIMGRIFKNASTKPKIPVKVCAKIVGVQKDPTQKTDLNQLFDELRAEGAAKTKSSDATMRKEPASTTATDEVKNAVDVVASAPVGAAVQPVPPAKLKSSKVAAKKANVTRKSQKNISKMQSELGMSQEEIEKLIDEGQRKSKRRCATNRPKKLVEMWSSDEYEEFLSTKDIIALIEEKEKQEKRRKRKNSLTNQTNQFGDTKDKDQEPDKDSLHAAEQKRKHIRSRSISEKREKPTCERSAKMPIAKKSAAVEELVRVDHHRVIAESATLKAESDNKVKSTSEKVNHDTLNSRSKSRRKKITGTTANTTATAALVNNGARGTRTRQSPDRAKEAPVEPSEDDCVLSDLKRNNHRTRNSKTAVRDRTPDIVCRTDVNSFKANRKSSVIAAPEAPKKRSSGKSKRKTLAKQSPARKKRLASEKLYYWSSSSDDEFGRIETSNPQAEFGESGEQYQQHGWIVGDSHKKLVTLLAIAKGNKKVENCGVKKRISKKKS